MPQRARSTLRQRLLQPTSFRWHRTVSLLKRRTCIPVLLTTDGLAPTSDLQYAPVRYHARALRDRLGVAVRFMNIEDALRLGAAQLRQYDLVGVKLSFRTSAEAALSTLRALRERIGPAATRLVYFDGDDDLCVQWPPLLRLVDLYVKKHVFRELTSYRPFVGKSNLTDYVARTHGFDFRDDTIPSFPGLSPEEAAKVHLGWNVAFDEPIRRLACRRLAPIPKDTDVICRASVRSGDWVEPLRRPVLEILESTGARWKVLTPRQRVPQRQYYQELLRSRVCISPFGYGEICWRDFEAILCGCLLVKPDVGHLRTYPDVFVPGKTYVPVRWDYGDLVETCAHFLSDEPERLRIVRRAREVLDQATRPDAFVSAFAHLLDRAGIPVTALPPVEAAVGAGEV
ncbi:MAG TPA: glycosyltransferase [Anaeromyxobacter sp.]|nr:glycosyltransferase [Anaeromyxobacter sp.]HVP60677.1 glycosyltransferase [Myxococcaceae bacterium]